MTDWQRAKIRSAINDRDGEEGGVMDESRSRHGLDGDDRTVHQLEHYLGFRLQVASRYDESWNGAVGSVDVFDGGTRSFRTEALVSEEFARVQHGLGPVDVAASLALRLAREVIDGGKFTPGETYRDVWS
jgi:hypothetical protein